jgi:hypothetical protein
LYVDQAGGTMEHTTYDRVPRRATQIPRRGRG